MRKLLEKKSFFLFGPRQTGKTSLIRNTLENAIVYNLLESDAFLALSRRPALLREENTKNGSLVVIDEIQKLPILLDEIHLLIEERNVRFLLTGSSARKLRRGGVNLLGGRARSRNLNPFISRELNDFNLLKALNHGLLPSIYFSDSPEEDLASYAGDYLREEIAAEGLTRNIPAFSRFLDVAAACNGQLVNYSKISSDAQVARSTVQEYFQILQDTLVAHVLPAWKKTTKRKPITRAKFYLFDVGVARHLQHRGVLKHQSPEFGEAFETYIFHELKSYLDYTRSGTLCYWRSKSQFEVDFILNDVTAIEVKAKQVVGSRDLRGMKALKEEALLGNYLIVSLADRPRIVDGIKILPWRDFLDRLWDGEFL
ncbi:MAG: ATP-binding protein [Deltaproteobacteria bacterium]|nr:ATP-binding protein [Deltaproteobacteria bacterium]